MSLSALDWVMAIGQGAIDVVDGNWVGLGEDALSTIAKTTGTDGSPDALKNAPVPSDEQKSIIQSAIKS